MSGLIRVTADDLPPPNQQELREFDSISSDDIDLTDIPELISPTDSSSTRLICLRIDRELPKALRSRGQVAEQVNNALRAYLKNIPGDAA